MSAPEPLAEQFEEHRPHVRAVAYRMLGSVGEADAILADSVGLTLLVVFEKLEPAERLGFVLYDVFAMSFEEIAPIVDRSVVATGQLASRARRRVRGQAPASSLRARALKGQP